ncbi:O-antigen ligase [Anaeromyxobacter sp. SG64]|uniref:O-antigen ligase family protein n=1 Tax=Anaeromyxobacter sp. SG64 TaxID=2925409 RepID=UPI001F56E0FB|nr:O-antigen ligase family protein [Anaeromyxobacter sp. SG64]
MKSLSARDSGYTPHPGTADMRVISTKFLPLLLLFASLLLFRSRSFAEATEIDLLTVHKVIALPFAILFAGGYLVLRGPPRRWPAALSFLAVYICVGIISTGLTSRSPYSLWKLSELVMVLVVGLYVLRMSRSRPEFASEAYELWLKFLGVLVVAALVGALMFPGDALKAPLTEESLELYGKPILPIQLFGVLLTVNPNSLGAMAAILLVVAMARFRDSCSGTRRVWRMLWIGALVAVLVLAQSRTAWMGLGAALVAGIWLARRASRAAKALALASLAASATYASAYIYAYMTRGVSTEQLSNLSGRAAWWSAAFQAFLDADFLGKTFGLGFMVANRTILSTQFGSDAGSLHSDYVDALVSTGVVGTIALIIAACAFALSVRNASPYQRAELAGIVCILGVRSFTGTTFAIHNHFLPALVLIPVLTEAMQKARTRVRAASLPDSFPVPRAQV